MVAKGICYVAGAGENYGLDFVPGPEDMVIGADAGVRYLERAGIPIDAAVGDFDTLRYIPEYDNVIALSAQKDETDMRAAVREGIRAGYEKFHIFCGTGGRADHTLANVQLLAELSRAGRRGFLHGKDNVTTAVTNGTIAFRAGCAGYVSVFSHSDRSAGVFLKGLKYELEDAVLTNGFPLGVSNEFTGRESRITVRNGTLVVIFPLGAECLENDAE